MSQTSTTTVQLGEQADNGSYVEIVRPIDDTSSDYISTFIKYQCHGVVDVDVQLPDVSEGTPHIGIVFSNGSREYFDGHIHDFEL